MKANKVIELAKDAGAKVFPITNNGVTHFRIVIADNGASGNGADFIHKFAKLIQKHDINICLKIGENFRDFDDVTIGECVKVIRNDE